jgi:hypothetical protein
LILVLAALFFILWRDYRSAVTGIEANRRVYGQLIELKEINGNYLMTGTTFPLLSLTSLGRSPTNAIALNDTFASSEHALVALRNGQWWLEDRNSRNGTTLNEVLITRPAIITDGDIIGIGNIRFRMELEQ